MLAVHNIHVCWPQIARCVSVLVCYKILSVSLQSNMYEHCQLMFKWAQYLKNVDG